RSRGRRGGRPRRIRGTNRPAARPGRRLARIFVALGRLAAARIQASPETPDFAGLLSSEAPSRRPKPLVNRRRLSCKIAPRPISGAGVFGASAGRAFWFAAIAQLVEHVIRNDGVTGSSPVCG